ILSEIELFYMLPHQRRKNNWFPELIFSLDKLYDIITKIQHNNWDDAVTPFVPNTLLKIIDKDQLKDKENLFQKLKEVEEKIQKLTESENKIIEEKIQN
ncbi:16608_t:CDS:2, partial [Racocetra persica]